MGLNLVIGCHYHRERVWFYRRAEQGIHDFYRAHWQCANLGHLELSDDQGPHDWVWDDTHVDVGAAYGVDHDDPYPARPAGALADPPVTHTRKGATDE